MKIVLLNVLGTILGFEEIKIKKNLIIALKQLMSDSVADWLIDPCVGLEKG